MNDGSPTELEITPRDIGIENGKSIPSELTKQIKTVTSEAKVTPAVKGVEPAVPSIGTTEFLGFGKRLATSEERRDQRLPKDALITNWDYVGRIVNRVYDLEEAVKIPGVGTLTNVLSDWMGLEDQVKWNAALQHAGKIGKESPPYLSGIRELLREEFHSDTVRVSRGIGSSGKMSRALEREFINVTLSRRKALDFENTAREFRGKKPVTKPSIDSVLVKIDDIVAIGGVPESELIIPSDVLKDRIAHPLQVPSNEIATSKSQIIKKFVNSLKRMVSPRKS